MINYWPLLGIALVVLGFALRLNPLLVVATAAVATGLLGGFTTFSAFSLDALTLWERGQVGVALAYVLASVVVSLLAVAAGFFLSRAF